MFSVLLRRNDTDELPTRASNSFSIVLNSQQELRAFLETLDFVNSKVGIYMNGRSGTGKTSCAGGLKDCPGARCLFCNAIVPGTESFPDEVTVKLLSYDGKGIYDVVRNRKVCKPKWAIFTPRNPNWSSSLESAPSSEFPFLLDATSSLGTSINYNSTRVFNIEIWKSKISAGSLTIFDFPGPENLGELEKQFQAKGHAKAKDILPMEEQKKTSSTINRTLSDIARLLKSQRMPGKFGLSKAIMSAISGSDTFVVITTVKNMHTDLNGSILEMQKVLVDWWLFTHNEESYNMLTRSPIFPLSKTIQLEHSVRSSTLNARSVEEARATLQVPMRAFMNFSPVMTASGYVVKF